MRMQKSVKLILSGKIVYEASCTTSIIIESILYKKHHHRSSNIIQMVELW